MSRNSRVFTTLRKSGAKSERSTWVEIHVCLQHCQTTKKENKGSTWVEIHVCLQLGCWLDAASSRSTWVEIHVCLQPPKVK